jgi:hypothetical protein
VGDRHDPPGAEAGDEGPGSAPTEGDGAAPEDEWPGLAGEPGPVAGAERGEAVPAGDHKKGGWTTGSVGNRVGGSGTGEVEVPAKGKTDSSNTTWREMRTRREERSKHRYPL